MALARIACNSNFNQAKAWQELKGVYPQQQQYSSLIFASCSVGDKIWFSIDDIVHNSNPKWKELHTMCLMPSRIDINLFNIKEGLCNEDNNNKGNNRCNDYCNTSCNSDCCDSRLPGITRSVAAERRTKVEQPSWSWISRTQSSTWGNRTSSYLAEKRQQNRKAQKEYAQHYHRLRQDVSLLRQSWGVLQGQTAHRQVVG